MKYIKLIAEKTTDIDYQVDILNGATALHLVLDAHMITFASEVNGGLKNYSTDALFIMDEDCTLTRSIGSFMSIGNEGWTLTVGAANITITLGSPTNSKPDPYGDADKTLEIINFFNSKEANLNCPDKLGRTPFYIACLKDNVQVVKALKDLGADINQLNQLGFHPIHGAIHHGNTAVVEELLKMGVNIDTKSTSGYTPLQYYCELAGNTLEVVHFLLSKGASLHCTQGDNAKTILHSAVISNNVPLVEFVLGEGFNINALTSDQISPLYYSLGYYNQPISLEMVNYLISKGADVNQPMYDGDMPMHMAGYRSRVDIMKILKAEGADINAVNQGGKTPLNLVIEQEGYATLEQKLVAVKYLLEEGGVIGKGSQHPVIGNFLGKVLSFVGDDDMLTRQEELIDLLKTSKQILMLPFATENEYAFEPHIAGDQYHYDAL